MTHGSNQTGKSFFEENYKKIQKRMLFKCKNKKVWSQKINSSVDLKNFQLTAIEKKILKKETKKKKVHKKKTQTSA